MGTYEFIEQGNIVVDVSDCDFEVADVVQWRASVVRRSHGDVYNFLSCRLIPIKNLRIKNVEHFNK
jgi:hypothetical protein